MQNVVEVPCASMRVRFLVCARVWECARARACMRVCAHTIPAFVFVCVCAGVVSTRARVDWRASAQQRAATLDSLAACVSLTLGWRQYRWDAATKKWLSWPKQYFIDSDQTLAQGGHRCVADA